MVSKKRFKIYQDSIRKFESNRVWGVKSETNSLEPYMTFKEAEKCCDLLNEQQDIIFKLQDLCGKSDAENAKLRIKNKRLQEENEELRFALRAEQALAKIQSTK